MKQTFSTINDIDFIEKFNEIKENNQLDSSNIVYNETTTSLVRSTWDDEQQEIIEPQKEPILKEISLYNPCKSREENFEDDESSKFLLVRVEKTGKLEIEKNIPDQFSKCVIDLNSVEEYGSEIEMIVIDYDSIFGLRLTSFIQYNSAFFTCDERVFFEALIIKYKLFNHKPFYWSKEVILRELGIKKDRVKKIIIRFKELGIISTEVKRSVLDGRPQQITYFDIRSNKILELLPQIFIDRDFSLIQKELKKYLKLEND